MAPALAAGRADLDAGDSRHRPRRRLRLRRVADLRRLVVARASQPDVGHRSARSGNQRAADDPEARDDRHQLQARRASDGRADAGAAAGLAGRRVLRVRRNLRRDPARLPRAGVRLVRDAGSVLAGEVRRARSRARAVARAAVRVLPDDQHAFPVHPDAAVPAGLDAGCSSRHPYDGPSIVRAYAQQPDWTHFGPGYVQAISLRLRDAGGLSAAERRTATGDDRARRPRAGGGGQRRRRAVGRAGARDRQPPGDPRRAARARLPQRPDPGAPVARQDAHAAADAAGAFSSR